MARIGERPGSGIAGARITWAGERAIRVLEDHGLLKLPVSPNVIAANLGIAISEIALDGIDGCLMRCGKKGKIIVNASVPQEGRKNFTIAHELGHWHLHPHLNQNWLCSADDIGGYKGSAPELEANAFASELLMPTSLLKERLKYASPTIRESAKISADCGTTLTAAALRLVELIEVPALAILSSDNIVRWFAKNDKADERFIQRGQQIGDDALAWNCLTDIADVGEPEEVDSSAWFPDDFRCERLETYEQSVVLGSYNVVLSLLSVYEK